ncbi:GM26561 [Drosophila sechellia]|uniref:GM26561 n=1 Tax=Drosophila sechellia TaxID=7238 RepID=B4IE19_DROSE|nr:GM26561 [Drosophila sechellia]
MRRISATKLKLPTGMRTGMIGPHRSRLIGFGIFFVRTPLISELTRFHSTCWLCNSARSSGTSSTHVLSYARRHSHIHENDYDHSSKRRIIRLRVLTSKIRNYPHPALRHHECECESKSASHNDDDLRLPLVGPKINQAKSRAAGKEELGCGGSASSALRSLPL